jgi:hypothetical protein
MMSTKKARKNSSKLDLPTIHCECGHKILLIPDTKVMGQTINEHALDHKRKYTLTEEETGTLEDELISQVFELLSKQNKSKKRLKLT